MATQSAMNATISAAPAPTATAEIRRLNHLARGMGIFWQVITYLFLGGALVAVFTQRPALVAQPRGWAVIVVALMFAGAYTLGYRWLAGARPECHWKALTQGVLPPHPLRAVGFWGGLMGLCALLYALAPQFAPLFWVVYGISFTMLPMPWAFLLIVPSSVAVIAAMGWLPQRLDPQSLSDFLLVLTVFAVYSFVVYIPMALLRGRYAREATLRDLEASHHALEEAHGRLAASAARDRELAVLRERERIARDMHDTLGHSLALIAVRLDAAQRLRAVDAERADREITTTQAVARAALTDLRATLDDLRGATQAQPSLGEALARLAREAGARAGWSVVCDTRDDLGVVDERLRLELLRIGAEAITNVERHAHASAVRLTLRREDQTLVLRVEDNGVGLPALVPVVVPVVVPVGASGGAETTDGSGTPLPGETSGHYGLRGMRERAREIGATLRLSPATPDGSGLVVEARAPLCGL